MKRILVDVSCCCNINKRHRGVLSFYFGMLIFVVSLLLRIFVRGLDPCISRDGCLYIQMAQLWAENNNGYNETLKLNPMGTPPLFLYMMVLMIRLGISAESSGIGISVFFGALCPSLVYNITKEILPGKRRIAFFAAILASVNPSMIKLSIEPQRDMIYLFFCGCLCLLLLKALRQKKWHLWCFAGGIFALSLQTRFETLEFIPITIFTFLSCIIKKTIPVKITIHVLLFLTGAIAVTILLFYLMESHILTVTEYVNIFEAKWRTVSEWEQIE